MKNIFYGTLSRIFIGVCIPLFFIFCWEQPSVFADTHVNSSITTNILWDSAYSPYDIDSSIEIASGTTLTIQPGVQINFSSNAGMTIFGSLVFSGTSQRKVILTAGASSLPNWQIQSIGGQLSIVNTSFSKGAGIAAFNNSAVSVIDSDFDDVANPLSVYSTSTLSVASTTFKNFSGSAIQAFNIAPFECNNCTIIGNQTGSTPSIAVYSGSTFKLNNSSVMMSGSQAALMIYNSSNGDSTHATISNSIFDGGTGEGIMLFGSSTLTLDHSTVKNFSESGILSYSNSHLTIANSTISNNSNGIEAYQGVIAIVSTSSISNNTNFGILSHTTNPVQTQNNWWGDPSGPLNESSNPTGVGNQVTDEVYFSPWLKQDPNALLCCSNIAFLPGIEGSRLYEPTITLPGLPQETRYWEPGLTTNTSVLNLNKDGTSIKKDIYTRDIIDSGSVGTIPVQDIYGIFEKHLDSLVTNQTISAWKALPYDWRYAADVIASSSIALQNNQSYSLVESIEQLAKSSKTGKVTIIGHSYGGLVAKELINLLVAKKEANLVDKLILVASPQLGTPEAISAILHGDNQSLFYGAVLQAKTARDLAKNMPMAYELLPAASYFESSSSGSTIVFDSTVDQVNNFRKVYGNSISSIQTLDSFLTGVDGRAHPQSSDLKNPTVLSMSLLASSTLVHTELDSWIAPPGIMTYQIAGVGEPTLQAVEYFGTRSCALGAFLCGNYYLDHKPIETDDGDGIVLSTSATAYSGADTAYINLLKYNNDTHSNIQHPTILEIPDTEKFIDSVIAGDTNVFSSSYISALKPIPHPLLTIGIHSPVSLDVYDASGNRAGFDSETSTSSSDFEFVDNTIPNSNYFRFGEGVYLSAPAQGNYQLKINGQDSGSFSVTLDQSVGGVVSTSTDFSNIAVSTTTQASLSILNGSSTNILLDNNGDNTVDVIIAPDQVVTSSAESLWDRLREFINVYCGRSDKISFLVLIQQLIIKAKALKKEDALKNSISNLGTQYKDTKFDQPTARKFINDFLTSLTKELK